MTETIEGHGGDLALAALRAFGVEELFTLSGGHVFPLYDAAHQTGVRIVDVRHEQSAVFAAEAVAKLQRRPGLAVLTAGPGVTNGVSGLTSALLQRRAGARARRPGAAVPLGLGQPAGDGPRADRRRRSPSTRRRSSPPTRSPGACTHAALAALTPHRGPGLPRPAAGRDLLAPATARRCRRHRPSPRVEPDPDDVAQGGRAARRAPSAR